MSSVGAAPRAAVSSARAAASRKNGARSRGPKTPEGKARAAQNALKHGLRAQKHVVLPEEDGREFAALVAAFIEELSPVGALQPCSRSALRSPPGVLCARTASKRRCSGTSGAGTATSASP